MSAEVVENGSRYEEVGQETSQMAWGLGERPWIPWLLSARNITALRGNETEVPADNNNGGTTIEAPSAECESDPDSEFATSANQNPSTYDDDAYFDALYIAMATSASSSGEQRRSPASSTGPPATDLNRSCDLEALALRLLWQNQFQDLRCRRATQIRNQGQARPPEHNFTQQAERRESRQAELEADDRLSQIMSDLRKLGTRLREDARKQLDVISDDNAALPLCL
jgi:hypothetical protein